MFFFLTEESERAVLPINKIGFTKKKNMNRDAYKQGLKIHKQFLPLVSMLHKVESLISKHPPDEKKYLLQDLKKKYEQHLKTKEDHHYHIVKVGQKDEISLRYFTLREGENDPFF